MNTNRFKYTKLMEEAIGSEKSSRALHNRSVDKNERASGSEKLTKVKALRKVRQFMDGLAKGDEYDRLLLKQLRLERDYIRKKEMNKLIIEIERTTKRAAGGSYNGAETGKVLGITRERVRQIEAAATKLLQHPSVARRLKAYQEE